jgi:hypothetical protein
LAGNCSPVGFVIVEPMSINVKFVAKVRQRPKAREDEVFAALQAWVFEDEHLDKRDVVVDILGGGPGNPIVRMEAYTVRPVIISRFSTWSKQAEGRLRQRIAGAGGDDVSLAFEFPDEAGCTCPSSTLPICSSAC